MKLLSPLQLSLGLTATVLALLSAPTGQAAPFASCLTVTNGNVSFYLNEGGGSVTVTYEDGSTNVSFNGLTTGTNVAAGLQSFALNGHTGYAISCHKSGSGAPVKLSTDTGFYNTWVSPRGVDANKNPQFGNLFGRVYVGNSTPGTVNSGPFKGRGIYCLSPDLSTNLLAAGTNASAGSVFTNASASSPYRITIAGDNSVYVTDYSTAGATVWQFGPSFEFTNDVLGPVGEVQGQTAGSHGDPIGVFVTGTIADGNLVVYTADPGLGAPASAQKGVGGEGPTQTGDDNDIFRYDIGAGPLPWTNAPNFAVSVGLPGFLDSQTLDLTVETNGYIVGMFRRANYSDGNIQVFDQNGNIIYNSLVPPASDAFVGAINGVGGAYGGVRISPDNRFLATLTYYNEIEVCSLTNGLPDVSTMIRIANTPATSASRGIAFDAADNIIVNSSGQGYLRCYSLGYTSTTITTNDITGTNGGFQFILPPVNASLAVTTATASQNYVNSATPGVPIPGVFTINLSTNYLAAPVTVNFTLSGSALYRTNYTINLGTDANGVLISSNTVTFPAGTYPGGNWAANVLITPTATPVSGPTLTVNMTVTGGASYFPAVPLVGSVTINNTGPQLLVLSSATYGSTMRRGVVNDYAKFIITRYGDLTQSTYTITNFTYGGSAAFPLDYTAKAQNYSPASSPVDGTPGITFNPGDVSITNLVGNPVAHANLAQLATNVTIVISLTNTATGTNLTSQEGVVYSTTPASVTLTELDNVTGPEVVLWSDPLTNSAASNWTLTFATTALGTNTVLPVVIPNYTNNTPDSITTGGTNDYTVVLGSPVASDNVPVSPAMAANGWTNALKMTVNKNNGAISAVNLYPQGLNFQGNYGLRFSMYLSLYSSARNNPYAGTASREFALFGINHHGTNCVWRPAASIAAGTGSGPTNSDGIWFAIDAGTGSQTPADFDALTSPALPNAGVAADLVSNNGLVEGGVFKHPPFDAMTASGGEPVDQWVDVSVQSTAQTNVTLLINGSQVLTSFSNTNGGGYTNGTIMLGYLDPVANVSDASAFAYYSNLRVVELSPYITTQPVGKLIAAGQNASFTSAASFSTAPLTNIWYVGNSNPVAAVQTDVSATTNLSSTLSLTGLQTGTNYYAVFSDAAGSVTGLVASVEVVQGPANLTTNAGSTVRLTALATGSATPTFQWKFNGVNLANNTRYAGVTTNTLIITNVQASVAGTYTLVVSNAFGTLSFPATLTVVQPASPALGTVGMVGTNVVVSFSTPDPNATTGSFLLLSSPNVNGPYVTNSAAVFTGSGSSFQISVPRATNASMFYRLLDLN